MSAPALRPYLPADAEALSRIFRAAVEELTVDDYDEDQRAALERAFEDAGFEVLSFEDGDELLDYVQLPHPRPVDALVTDLQMPGHSGVEGLRQARARKDPRQLFTVQLLIQVSKPAP